MTSKRKSMAVTGKGVNAFFEEKTAKQTTATSIQDDKAVSKHTSKDVEQQSDIDLQRATFYIAPEQHTQLEELRIKLRKHKIKTNKSELVRIAIDLLAEQDVDLLVKLLTGKQVVP
jgi:hypothetical protein